MKKPKIRYIDLLAQNIKLNKVIKTKNRTISFLSSAMFYYYKKVHQLEDKINDLQNELNNFVQDDIK